MAIATALANEPDILLADEPTGELDSKTARRAFGALQTANSGLGVTILVVSHDPGCPARFAGQFRSGTAGPAPRPCGAAPSTTAGRRRIMRLSTRWWIGRAGFSCRAT